MTHYFGVRETSICEHEENLSTKDGLIAGSIAHRKKFDTCKRDSQTKVTDLMGDENETDGGDGNSKVRTTFKAVGPRFKLE